LPQLTLVASDERVSSEMFASYNDSWYSTYIPLRGTSDQLKNCTPGPWKIKHTAGLWAFSQSSASILSVLFFLKL